MAEKIPGSSENNENGFRAPNDQELNDVAENVVASQESFNQQAESAAPEED